MQIFKIFVGAAVLILLSALVVTARNAERIYGKITTVDGDVLEGLIRWDKNEGCWLDLLDGSKDRADYDRDHRRSERKKYRNKRTTWKLFGVTIEDTDGEHWHWSSTAQSGIRFGHIAAMEIIDDDRVLLELKSGKEVELFNGSTDIGTSIRELVIEDEREGEIELDWDDVERVELSAATTSGISNFGERLYGTLTTRRGDEFTGFVCWDVDEIFTRDVLDGKEKGRSRKIRFGKIAAIERYSSNGARVELKSGDDMVLRGTNDVDSDNRGIIICDPGFGQVKVEWDDFERVTFSDKPAKVAYTDFDGGRPLEGTVFTEDGDEYTGRISWDDDEEYTWELLNGEYRGMEFKLEFGLIKAIEKKSYREAIITVWNGRTFHLQGSNDVDEDNKGIYVTLPDGNEIAVDWDEFKRIEFTKR